MKKFLLSCPENEAWVTSQEKTHDAVLKNEMRARLIKKELYPELHQAAISALAVGRNQAHSLIYVEAKQRSLHRGLMEEFVQKYGISSKGGKSIRLYRTSPWRA